AADHATDAGGDPLGTEVGIGSVAGDADTRILASVGRRGVTVIVEAVAKVESASRRVAARDRAIDARVHALVAQVGVGAVAGHADRRVLGPIGRRGIAVVIGAVAKIEVVARRVVAADRAAGTHRRSFVAEVTIRTVAGDTDAGVFRAVGRGRVAVIIGAVAQIERAAGRDVAGRHTTRANRDPLVAQVGVGAVAGDADRRVLGPIGRRGIAVVIGTVAQIERAAGRVVAARRSTRAYRHPFVAQVGVGAVARHSDRGVLRPIGRRGIAIVVGAVAEVHGASREVRAGV